MARPEAAPRMGAEVRDGFARKVDLGEERIERGGHAAPPDGVPENDKVDVGEIGERPNDLGMFARFQFALRDDGRFPIVGGVRLHRANFENAGAERFGDAAREPFGVPDLKHLRAARGVVLAATGIEDDERALRIERSIGRRPGLGTARGKSIRKRGGDAGADGGGTERTTLHDTTPKKKAKEDDGREANAVEAPCRLRPALRPPRRLLHDARRRATDLAWV